MPHQPEVADSDQWQRYFAMQANNRAWQLAVASRSPAEDKEMLDAAHAAAWHWQVVGEELHHMRAKLLLAEVHALLGLGPSAIAYIDQVQPFFLSRQTEDWELAYVHVIAAHAAAVAGEESRHLESWALAKSSLAAVADPEDQRIVEQTFVGVPPPPGRR